MKPFPRARRNSVSPITQLTSRGRRKAPVKKIRIRCTRIAPTKSSAAQWCVWRITSPARTSKLSFSVDAYAADMRTPSSGL